MGQDVVKLTVDIQAKVSNLESELSKMQKAFNSLEGPEKLSSEIKGAFGDLENRLKKVKDYTNNNQLKIIDSKKVQGELNEIVQDYNKLINRIGDNKGKFGLAEVSKEGIALKNAIEGYNKAVEKGKKPIEEQLKAYQKLQEEIKKAKINLEVKTERKNSAQANFNALSKQTEELEKQRTVLEQQSKQIEEQIKSTKALLEARKNALIEKGGAGARPQNLHMVDTLSKEAIELRELQSEQDKLNQSLEKSKEAITANETELANAKRELTSAISSVTSAQHNLVDTEAKVGKKLTEVNQKFGNQGITIKNLDITIQNLEKSIEQLNSDEFEKLKGSLAELEGKGLINLGFDLNEIKTVEQFEQKLKEINEQDFEKVQIAVKALIEGLKRGKEESDPLNENIRKDTEAAIDFNKELGNIKGKIEYFFGLDNAIRLFRQSVRKAIETVKDLDKVMTETAVVTNFSVSDMWSQLPEYTKRANALGVSIHDMYEASTLYYQQGLKTNEVMALSNETLKMARIAGLDAADATDRMTNALRGFNMEITETNAQNINDVYSNLAAKTASNVDEISTAMTKVASLAHNANMSFENTAAFLSQIIETTRESAETAGTALKTVIARFSEVKNLYSEGDLLGTDAEGEEIDVNKVSKALRSAGIDLNEYLTGAKGLDEIFMELSEKWDSLDKVQQRYIATMAAGSRQQSRFIALMQDYNRMQELVSEANNASGASQEQFNKTLESLESKLTRLKNAWDTFLMGLSNNEFIKSAVDLLTDLLNGLNYLLGPLDNISKSVASLGVAFGSLLAGKSIFNKIFGQRESGLIPKFIGAIGLGKGRSGETIITGGIVKNLQEGISKGIKNLKTNGLKKIFSDKIRSVFGFKSYKPSDLGIEPDEILDFSKLDFSKVDMTKFKQNLVKQVASFEDIDINTKVNLNNLINEGDIQKIEEGFKQAGHSIEITGQAAEQCGIRIQDTTKSMHNIANVAGTVGGALLALTSIMESWGSGWQEAAGYIRIFAIALMALPAVLKVVEIAAQIFSVNVTASFLSIPIVGWIAAAITAIGALIAIFIKYNKENSAETKLKKMEEATQQVEEAANKAAEAYKNLSDSIETLGDKYKDIEKLTKGTKEWYDKVLEINGVVLELIEKYPELSGYITDTNGYLEINFNDSGVQDIIKSYQQASFQAAGVATLMKRALLRENNDFEYSRLKTKVSRNVANYSYGNYIGGTGDVDQKELTDKLALALVKGEIFDQESLDKWKEHNGIENIDYIPAIGKGNTVFYSGIGTYEEAFRRYKNYGKIKLEEEQQAEAYYKMVASDAINSMNLDGYTNEQVNMLKNYLNSGLIEAVKKDEENKLKVLDKKALSEDIEYENYWKQVLSLEGKTFKSVGDYGKIIYEDENGKEQIIKSENAQDRYTSAKAVKNAADSAEIFINVQELDDLTKKIYSKQEGKNITKGDIDELLKGKGKDEDVETFLRNEFTKSGSSLNNIMTSIWEDIDWDNLTEEQKNFIDNYIKSIMQASDRITKVSEFLTSADINTSGVQEVTTKLTSGAIEVYSELIQNLYSFNKDTAEQVSDIIGNLGLEGEKAEKFATALERMDWSDPINSAREFDKILSDLGIKIEDTDGNYEKFISKMIEYGKSIEKVNIDALINRINKLSSVLSKFNKGEGSRVFSEEEYNNLIEANPSMIGDFIKDLDGNFVYIGGTMENLQKAIEDATLVIGERNKDLIEARIKTGDILKSQGFNVTEFEKLSPEQQENTFQAYLNKLKSAGVNLADLGLGITNSTTARELVASGRLDEVIEGLGKIMGETEINREKYNKLVTEESGRERIYKYNAHQNAQDASANEYAAAALVAQANTAGVANEYIDAFTIAMNEGTNREKQIWADRLADMIDIYSEATSLGIDTGELDAYAKQLENMYDIPIDEAYRLALANAKLNKGYKEIKDTYDDWSKLIKDGKIEAHTKDDLATYNKLKKAVAETFNISEDLAEEFLNSKENLEDLEKAAQGDEKALERLNKRAAAIKLRAKYTDAVEDINEFEDFLVDYDFSDIEVGATVDDSAFMDALQELVDATGMTVDELNEILGQFGFHAEPEVTFERKPNPAYKMYEAMGEYWEGPVPPRFTLMPVYDYSGSRVGKVTRTSKGLSDYFSNPSGGSGSGGSKDNKWKNPYDELFNHLERINEALRERQQLERDYQKLLKSSTATIAQIRQGYFDQIAALREAIRLQEQLASGRRSQIEALLSQTYTDSEGHTGTYASYGVGQYAHYDFETGQIVIDWEALERLAQSSSGSETGAAIEDYISKLQELVDSYEGVRDAIWEIEDQIEDLTKQAIESYMDFEDRVMEAVVAQYEKQIDAFEKMSDAINDATTKVLDGIQEQIDAERQARDNAKTEDEIARKEARLAYLRRDTSGANALEIKQLEEELEEARQNYEDTLIDQALEQMRKDADLAADQRAEQIEIMRAQLEMWKESGALWDEVYGLINGDRDELARLLMGQEGYEALSNFGKDEWWKQFTEAINAALEGLAAGGANYSGQHQGEGEGSGEGGSGEGSGGEGNGSGSATPREWPSDLPLPSTLLGTIQKGSKGTPVKAIQTALNMLGITDANGNELDEDGNFGSKTEAAVKKFQSQYGDPVLNADGKVGRHTKQKFALNEFKTGGIADFTGPAWLDGSRSKPELVLNAQDTQNFIALKNILAQLLSNQANGASAPTGDAYFDIDINAEIGSDYDVDQLANRIREQIEQESSYRNVNIMNFIR